MVGELAACAYKDPDEPGNHEHDCRGPGERENEPCSHGDQEAGEDAGRPCPRERRGLVVSERLPDAAETVHGTGLKEDGHTNDKANDQDCDSHAISLRCSGQLPQRILLTMSAKDPLEQSWASLLAGEATIGVQRSSLILVC